MNHPQILISTSSRKHGDHKMSRLHRVLDKVVSCLLKVGSFSYLLPDSLELTLWACIIAYFAIQLAQPQV